MACIWNAKQSFLKIIAYKERNLTPAYNQHLNQTNLILRMTSRDNVNETLSKLVNYKKSYAKNYYKRFQLPRINWYGFLFEVALSQKFLKQIWFSGRLSKSKHTAIFLKLIVHVRLFDRPLSSILRIIKSSRTKLINLFPFSIRWS